MNFIQAAKLTSQTAAGRYLL